MKPTLLPLLTIALTVGLAVSFAASSASAQPACAEQLTGRVLNAAGDGIEGATVGLYATEPDAAGELPALQTTTNKRGEYSFKNLCDGLYEVIAEAPEHQTRAETLHLQASAALDLPLSPLLEADAGNDVLVEATADTNAPDTNARQTLEGPALDRARGLSLGQTLKALPGVQALETGTVSKPVIHGLHSNRVLILTDGVRHAGQSWGLDHAPEIDPFGADKLTVVKGAAGVRYGAEALGGVILVESAPLPTDPETFEGEADLIGASNGRSGVGALLLRGGVPGVEGLGWRLQTSGKLAGSLDTPQYPLNNTGARELNLQGAVGWRRPGLGGEVGARRFSTEIGVFTGQVSDNANQFREAIQRPRPFNADRYAFSYAIDRPRQEVVHTQLQARAHADDPGWGKLQLQLAHQWDDRLEFDIVRGNIEGPQLDFDLRTSTGELSWDQSFNEKILIGLTASGGYQENRYTGRRLIPNYRALDGGAAAWAQLRLGDAELEAGARLDTRSVDTFQRERVGGSSAAIDTEHLSFLSPSLLLGARLHPSHALTVALNLALASRSPTINELFIDGVSQGLGAFERGDLDLPVEQTAGATLDLNWSAPGLLVQATAYAQRMDDFIYLAPLLGEDGSLQVTLTSNGGYPTFAYRPIDALFVGGEAEVAVRPAPWIEARTRISIVRAYNLETRTHLVAIPPDTVEPSLTLERSTLGPLRELWATLGATLLARQSRAPDAEDFAPAPEAAMLLNAGVGATVFSWGERGALQVNLEGRNLTDVRYRSYLSRLRYFADEPGRNLLLRLRAPF